MKLRKLFSHLQGRKSDKKLHPQHSRDQTGFKDVNVLLKFKVNTYLT